MPGRSYPRVRPEYGSYRWFQSQIGRMDEQVGPDPDQWEHGAEEYYHDLINRGAMRVYMLDDFSDGYRRKWSFLQTRFDIVTTANVGEYLLPEDCESVLGSLSFDTTDSAAGQVRKGTVEQILGWRSNNSTVTGYPEWYAEEFYDSGGVEQQRRRLLLWPTPGAVYTLHGSMDVMPMDMSKDKRPFAYGGRMLVEVLLASMQALVDPRMEDRYRRLLRSAVQHDETHQLPDTLGKNSNGRKNWPNMEDGRFINLDPVTYTSGS